ncbi:MAG: polyphosphate kinase 2, partial [Anaerolineaceae bacterium]
MAKRNSKTEKKADKSKSEETQGEPKVDIPGEKKKPLSNAVYERELRKLQIELVKLQLWIKERGLKVAVIFEGRDAAGKG